MEKQQEAGLNLPEKISVDMVLESRRNPVNHLIKEVRETKDLDEVFRLLDTQSWIVIWGAFDTVKGERIPKFCLARIV